MAERSLELHLVADLQRLHELAELAAVRKARVLIAPVHLQICATQFIFKLVLQSQNSS